jgi:hypothetical protein
MASQLFGVLPERTGLFTTTLSITQANGPTAWGAEQTAQVTAGILMARTGMKNISTLSAALLYRG